MADPMTPERLAEIREREQAASPGPWQAVGHSHIEKGCRCLSCWATTGWVLQHQLDCEEAALAQQRADSEPEPSETCECAVFSFADVDFIERAREDVPALLAEVERLRAELDDARAAAKRSDERLVSAYNDLCTAVDTRRTTLAGAIMHAAAVRTQRDRLAEQVKRAQDPDVLRRAIADPGAYVKRKRLDKGDYETVPAWSARAVIAALDGTGAGQ